jgi:type IV pilus assembly protein PilA
MRKLHTRKGGFTLIELMIVVAIIGILAAIAIPNFLMFQLRSKTGEAKTNLAGIRTAEEGYFAEFGSYVPAVAVTPAPGSQKNPWPAPGLAGGFDTLGWGPEGQVFFQYAIATNAAVGAVDYAAGGTGDLDGDGQPSDFGYIHPIPGAAAAAGTPNACPATGVYNPATLVNDLLNTVGPCNPQSGQSWF